MNKLTQPRILAEFGRKLLPADRHRDSALSLEAVAHSFQKVVSTAQQPAILGVWRMQLGVRYMLNW